MMSFKRVFSEVGKVFVAQIIPVHQRSGTPIQRSLRSVLIFRVPGGEGKLRPKPPRKDESEAPPHPHSHGGLVAAWCCFPCLGRSEFTRGNEKLRTVEREAAKTRDC